MHTCVLLTFDSSLTAAISSMDQWWSALIPDIFCLKLAWALFNINIIKTNLKMSSPLAIEKSLIDILDWVEFYALKDLTQNI